MKTIPILFLWLASCILSLGAGALNGVAVTHWNGIAFTAWNGSGVSAAGGGGGSPSFLINEGFESAGTPSGWYVNLASFDYSAAALIGSESARLSANGQYIGLTDGGVLNNAELYGKFRLKVETLPTGSSCKLIELWNTGFGSVLNFSVQPSGAISGPGGDTTDVITAGTSVWIYWHYLKGTGSNGVEEVGFATTETRPTSGTKYSGTTGSLATTNATQFQTAITNGAVLVIDQFQMAATAVD